MLIRPQPLIKSAAKSNFVRINNKKFSFGVYAQFKIKSEVNFTQNSHILQTLHNTHFMYMT